MRREYVRRCIASLQRAYDKLRRVDQEDPDYDIFRAACLKEFELIVELAAKLLRKELRPFFGSDRQADRLVYKDVFRYATRFRLMDTNTCERWLSYRDLRNIAAHEYGDDFANSVLEALPKFIADASSLASIEYDRTER